jgi:hypothetical protein
MTDFPSGRWSELLVGHQWPASTSLGILLTSADRRAEAELSQQEYAERLLTIRTVVLSAQEGMAAENIEGRFADGEREARRKSDHSEAKQTAYRAAIRATQDLRDSLTDIADQGNAEIEFILTSHRTLPEKLATTVTAIASAQTHANIKAAESSAHLLDAIQAILAWEGTSMAARQFAAANGVQMANAFQSQSPEDLTQHVEEILRDLQSDGGRDVSDRTPTRRPSENVFAAGEKIVSEPNQIDGKEPLVPTKVAEGAQAINSGKVLVREDITAGAAIIPEGTSIVPQHAAAGRLGLDGGQATLIAQPDLTTVTAQSVQVDILPNASTGSQFAAHTRISAGEPTNTAVLRDDHPLTKSLAHQTTPEPSSLTTRASSPLTNELGESFNAGNKSGSAASVGAEAISTAATTSLHTPHAGALTTPLAEAAAPRAPIFENAHPATPLIEAAQPHLPSDAPQAVITSSSPPVAAPMPAVNPIAPASPIPQGPLPGYGSDLRPPVATVSAPPPPMPAAPGSVPVAPASGTAGSGQPTLVRQQPTATPAAHSAVGLTERAFAATATGAAASAAAGASSADTRLRRLLGSVARQRPELRWAIGDLSDGSTVLTTDLADGWVPPGIEIPTGVRLLQPAVRHKGLLSLLGETTSAVSYSPGQYLSPDDTAPMSIRARDTAPVDDLGWELLQATRWRDGLPRLAHTLARAVSAQTGLIDSEVDLLSTHLNSVARTILAKYPTIEPTEVGNWQLLATIDALIKGQTTSANYHFAWFATQALIREGRS